MKLLQFFEVTNPNVKVKKKGNIYHAYLKGKWVGQAMVYDYETDGMDDNERHIWKSSVDPSMTRQGIATELYNVIADDLESQGLKLVPSPDQQLSGDAYQFWKARDPESIKNHGTFKAEKLQHLVGREIEVRGRPTVVTRVGWSKSGDTPLIGVRYTDVPEGSVNSTGQVRMADVQDQLTEAVEEKFGKSVVWDNGRFFIAVNNPDKPTFFTAWTQDNEKVATLSTKVMPKNGEQWMAVDYVEVDPTSQRQGIARALYHVMIDGMSPEYAGLFGYGPDIASQHVSKIYQRYGAHEQEDGHFYIPNPNRGVTEDEKLNLPDLETGDELMVGKFKNRRATIKGFTKDKHNQPIAKTNKGDQQIFKGRVKKLMDEAQMISSYEAAMLIAQDDELFDSVATYTTWPDVFDDHPEELAKFLNILRSVKPSNQRLYRGELEMEFNNFQPYPDHVERGFTSWSLNKDTPQKWFNEKGNIVKYTDGPLQAVSVSDIADARMRSHPDESHYGGGQSEVLVLEPVERKVEGVYESIGKNLMERFAQKDVDNVSWFWAHPESGKIYHFEGSHTTAAVEPGSPIELDMADFGGYNAEGAPADNYQVFEAAFRKGWVRSFYIPDEGSPLGNQIGLHGPDEESVKQTLQMLLDKGLQIDHVGMRGQFDKFEYDEPYDN